MEIEIITLKLCQLQEALLIKINIILYKHTTELWWSGSVSGCEQ